MATTVQPDIDWGLVRARCSPEGRGEYVSFLDQMRMYWPNAQAISGEDPSPERDARAGVRLIGRIEDPATDTYITTRVFMWSVLPIVAMGAFRVHDTGRGLLFVAREALPGWAKGLNVAMTCLALIVIALVTR